MSDPSYTQPTKTNWRSSLAAKPACSDVVSLLFSMPSLLPSWESIFSPPAFLPSLSGVYCSFLFLSLAC